VRVIEVSINDSVTLRARQEQLRVTEFEEVWLQARAEDGK